MQFYLALPHVNNMLNDDNCIWTVGVYVGLTCERKVFNTMQELIIYYRSGGNFLVCKLTDSCPKSSVDSASLEIERSSLVLHKRLSSSGSDDMWYGTWTRAGRQLPVHVQRLSPQLHSKTDVIHEMDMTCRFLHHNVVQLYGVSITREPMYVVSECLGNGSLLYYLREGGGRCISFREKIDLAVQIAYGIDYLHSQLCIHRNVCAKNVLLSETNVPKIANFRYAKILTGETTILQLPVEELHTRWYPPEVLESGHFSKKADIWSFGILLTEVLTNGKLPYSDVECREQLKWMVVNAGYRIPRSQLIDCPEQLYEVLSSCWRSQPTLRPKFEFIITGMSDCVPLDNGYMSTLH
jgi:serine/threonine protein kinase